MLFRSYATLGALAAAVAAPYALGAFGAGEAGALTTGEILGSTGFTPVGGASFSLPTAAGVAGAVGQALPYTEAYDAINLVNQGLSTEAVAQNLAATGMDEFLAADVANLASQGLSEAQISQIIGASYSAPELAGTAFESLGWGPTSSLASSLGLGEILKGLAGTKGLGLANLLREGRTSGLTPVIPKIPVLDRKSTRLNSSH